MNDIPDGIYDNKDTLQRERYKNGKLVSFITLGMLLSLKAPFIRSNWYKEWGSYAAPCGCHSIPQILPDDYKPGQHSQQIFVHCEAHKGGAAHSHTI